MVKRLSLDAMGMLDRSPLIAFAVGGLRISLIHFDLQWSGRPDLNRRPPAPEAGALPGYATPRRHPDRPCAWRNSNPQPSDP